MEFFKANFFLFSLIALALAIASVAWLGRRLIKDLGEHIQKEHKTCPYCAEQIKRAAKICRYCQHDVAGVEIENKTPRGLFK
ncbi:MAG: zinc ribbon domain-containing protein [Blastocatellia bacterium]